MQTESSFSENEFQKTIFNSKSFDFTEKAIELFYFQFLNNTTYRDYCKLIDCSPHKVNSLEKIPFLPISAFKTHPIKTGNFVAETVFNSSGTTGVQTSQHAVKDISIYENSFTIGFESLYGNIEEYCVLGLLPSYLERKGSSLIYMVNHFIQKSNHPSSGFFLNNTKELFEILSHLRNTNQKTLLIGVSFGLLNFAEEYTLPYHENLIVMETGGMKGRRKELIREELHEQLKKGFSTANIHSEYGMTELLSQAYSKGEGKFQTPPWMKILIRQQDDPFNWAETGKVGAINVIDLANIHSCAFIQTEDLGKKHEDQSFEVLGRFDASEVRGCNLMVL